jgi:acetyl-CoA acyltransferase 1
LESVKVQELFYEGAGVEQMSMHYGPVAMPVSNSEKVLANKSAADCLIPMGITSENVASRYGVNREKQDKFSVHSHQKAAAAQQKGLFKEEIVPVKTTILDKSGNAKEGN